MQASKTCKPREEPKKAPVVLMEDNLTKARKALMTPKQLCPTAAVGYEMEAKGPGEQGACLETGFKKRNTDQTRAYSESFSKYSGESKKGQKWCAEI